MFSLRTASLVAIIAAAVYYLLVRRITVAYHLSQDVSTPCTRVFQRISDVDFLVQANDKVVSLERLWAREEGDVTVIAVHAVETINVVWTTYNLGFDVTMYKDSAARTATMTVELAMLDASTVYSVEDLPDGGCRLHDNTTMRVAPALSGYVQTESLDGHTSLLRNIGGLLQQGQ